MQLILSVTGNPVADEIIELSVTLSELGNNKKELGFHDLGKVEIGYKSKKYTAHSDATSVRIDITCKLSNGEDISEKPISKVFVLEEGYHTVCEVSVDF